jgi:hypothetical protein
MFQIMHFLLVKVFDGCLDGILSFSVILVLMHGGSKVIGEVVIDDVIDSISKGCFRVEEALLVNSDNWASVVDTGSNEWMCVDGVTFFVGGGHLGL